MKDAIANIARDRNLPIFPATNASKISVISEALSECAASARNSIPLKKGLGTVDVNVLYRSQAAWQARYGNARTIATDPSDGDQAASFP
jgi:hypothetical protein